VAFGRRCSPLEELQNKRTWLGDVPVDVFDDAFQQIPLGFDVIPVTENQDTNLSDLLRDLWL